MVQNDGYNDAWNTAGWTAQNMAYPPPENTTIYFPTDIETVTISGHFRDGDGGLANGWFEIDNGGTILRHASTKETILPIKIKLEIKDGVFSVTVPATDASTVTSTPTPWTYHIRIALDGKLFKDLPAVSLTKATPNVDIFDILGAA